jgi:CRP-like cAMP-binding protein
MSARTYPRKAPLFQRGQPALGVYLVEKGEVRLRLYAEVQGHLGFDLAGPGAALGLSEVLTGETHKLTAEAIRPTQVSYIERNDLLQFLREHHECCLQVVHMLSEDLHGLYRRFRSEEGVRGSRTRKRSSFPIH